MSLLSWALRHGVGPAALHELQTELGLLTPPLPEAAPEFGKSEAFVQSQAVLEASRRGIRALRNNSGAFQNDTGQLVRFGLGNTSAAINKIMKSSDLIGWRPVVITAPMVGYKLAQFWAREIKEPGWQFTGAGREAPQKAFMDMVNAGGGDAAFITDAGQV